MSDIVYVPIIKTGDAEIRGIENLSDDVKNTITPLFDLTRSRKSKNIKQGDIFRRLNRLEEAYGKRQFVLDLITEPHLMNEQIRDLQDNNNGYENWIDFLISLKEKFPKVIPTILISYKGAKSDKEVYDRVKKQIESMEKHFNSIAYRFPLEHERFENDLSEICQVISGEKIICVIDAEFITQEKSGIYSEKAKSVINELDSLSLGKIVLSATSFPRNPTEFGEENYGEFRLEECLFYENVNTVVQSELLYGDYATINPIRSLQAGGQGWVPRIDMPTESTIFYYRSRRKKVEDEFKEKFPVVYTRVARRMIKDDRYKEVKDMIGNCWGIEQIELAAKGDPQGLSPSFWISVRMNIHITLRRNLLI